MALARLHASEITNGQIVDADDLNDEFNQLVNILNGTSNDKDAIIKLSDAAKAVLTLNQQNGTTGPILEGQQNAAAKFRFKNNGGLWIPSLTKSDGTDGITLNDTTNVWTFVNRPLLPNSDPTLANEATRKSYVDGKQTRWSANFTIQDPSTFPLNSFNLIQMARIPGANFTARWIEAVWLTGSASGSFTVALRKRGFGLGESGF